MSEIHSIDEAMSAAAASAVAFAQNFDIRLDFSESSVEKVEYIVGGLQNSMKRDRPPKKEVERLYTMMGAYVGEVIKRRWGGQWSWESKLHPGEKLLTLTAAGIELWPQVKVHKRLTEGPEENIWWYFQTFEKQVGKKGSPVVPTQRPWWKLW